MFLQRYEEHGEAFLRRIFTGDNTLVCHDTAESTAAESPWRSWLRLCAASWKVMSSNTDVVGILH